MANGRLNGKDMVTHTFPLEQIHEAVDTFVNRKEGAMKVVVHP
jgi:L-iditol 2-dehydrogenase